MTELQQQICDMITNIDDENRLAFLRIIIENEYKQSLSTSQQD